MIETGLLIVVVLFIGFKVISQRLSAINLTLMDRRGR